LFLIDAIAPPALSNGYANQSAGFLDNSSGFNGEYGELLRRISQPQAMLVGEPNHFRRGRVAAFGLLSSIP